MLVAHITGDVTVLREEWRPDPAVLPHGSLDPAEERRVREFCLDRLAAHLESTQPWPTRPSAEVLQAIGTWSLGPAVSQAAQLLDVAFVPDPDAVDNGR